MNDQTNPPSLDREKRKSLLSVGVLYDGHDTIDVRIRNLSPEGCGGRAAEHLPKDQSYEIELKGLGRIRGTIVWSSEKAFGMRFDEPVNLERLEMANASEVLLKQKYDPLKDYKPPEIYRRPGLNR